MRNECNLRTILSLRKSAFFECIAEHTWRSYEELVPKKNALLHVWFEMHFTLWFDFVNMVSMSPLCETGILAPILWESFRTDSGRASGFTADMNCLNARFSESGCEMQSTLWMRSLPRNTSPRGVANDSWTSPLPTAKCGCARSPSTGENG